MSIFDEVINRSGTGAIKLERYKAYKNALPMWVADMDFKSPSCIIEALTKRVEHGIFGYTDVEDDTKEAIINFAKRAHNYEIKKEWLIFPSGVVSSMSIASGILEDNEGVITTTPIYPYFQDCAQEMGKEVSTVKMANINNRWTFDMDELKKSIKPNSKLLFLCNPYNPGGTVFTKDELLKIAQIALENDLIICSDEIHCDLVIDESAKHIPIASLSPQIASRCITLMAPSKTFNIAGLQSSFAVIMNPELRSRFIKSMGHINGGVNLLGLCAMKAAYNGGGEWLRELKIYLGENLKLVNDFVKNNSKLKFLDMQATYLAWIDCRDLGVDAYSLFFNNGVILNDGKGYKEGGEGFVRLNFGTQREVLKEALKRMQEALDSLH